jgi:hypothetical protein
MDPNRLGSERGSRGLLTVLVVVGLLGAVAIAAAGHTPSGGGETRRPSEELVDTLISLYLVAAAATAAVVLYLLLMRRDIVAAAVGERQKRRRRGLTSLVVLLVLAVALGVFLRFFANPNGRQDVQPPTPIPTTGATTGDESDTYEPEFALAPVLVVVVIATAAAAAAILAARARRRALPGYEEEVAEALLDVLDETLDDLRLLQDTRRAVVAAYARLERTLAAYGLPRLAHEAPEEYLGRILEELEVGRRAVARLTTLYERAKFSNHDVEPGMKEEAIAALENVRDDLRAAEIRREVERAKALEAARAEAAAR